MTKGIFITGTGTDVGKTYISALIAKSMREKKFNCGYYKPALSGAEKIDGKIIPGDCSYVFKFAGIDKDPNDYVSYAFEPAVSPHLASKMANTPIQLNKIYKDFSRIKCEYEYLIVEGAGGIVCPFNTFEERKILTKDIINTLNLDIIIVAPASLGTINSTVLTVEYAENYGFCVRGIILNNFDENDFMQLDNKKMIEDITGVDVIATVKKDAETIDLEKIICTFKEI